MRGGYAWCAGRVDPPCGGPEPLGAGEVGEDRGFSTPRDGPSGSPWIKPSLQPRRTVDSPLLEAFNPLIRCKASSSLHSSWLIFAAHNKYLPRDLPAERISWQSPAWTCWSCCCSDEQQNLSISRLLGTCCKGFQQVLRPAMMGRQGFVEPQK